MWFGDLVTMGWWNGIWLNEAFATFMAIRCRDDYRPEWQCFVGFGRDAGRWRSPSTACTRRGRSSTRSHRPTRPTAMFDVLTYEKGASVLRMLEQYLGAERFRDGVRRYLADHLYGNTETDRPVGRDRGRGGGRARSARSWTRGSSKAATRCSPRRRRPTGRAPARRDPGAVRRAAGGRAPTAPGRAPSGRRLVRAARHRRRPAGERRYRAARGASRSSCRPATACSC